MRGLWTFLMTAAVFLIAVLGAATAVNHFFQKPYNEGFLRHPLIVKAHAALGGVYLFVGAFQFAPWIRNRWIGYHRTAGRVVAAFALVIGATALFIGIIIPFSGRAGQVVMAVFGGWFLTAIIAALINIRA